uniref:Uncharacterized protein n=1 Tax=Glossina pallidipes TaxID=7398 RepID=A0A1A9ZB04_GLOPL
MVDNRVKCMGRVSCHVEETVYNTSSRYAALKHLSLSMPLHMFESFLLICSEQLRHLLLVVTNTERPYPIAAAASTTQLCMKCDRSRCAVHSTDVISAHQNKSQQAMANILLT